MIIIYYYFFFNIIIFLIHKINDIRSSFLLNNSKARIVMKITYLPLISILYYYYYSLKVKQDSLIDIICIVHLQIIAMRDTAMRPHTSACRALVRAVAFSVGRDSLKGGESPAGAITAGSTTTVIIFRTMNRVFRHGGPDAGPG